MSKIIASAGIRGAYKIYDRVEGKYKAALDKYGADQEVGFPNTAYFLPVIFGMTGIKVEKLADMQQVFDLSKKLIPELVKEKHHLPYLGPALDAGMTALFLQEMEECLRYLTDPDFYLTSEDPTADKLWVGAADDVILRKRGVEFVDGTAPGFAAILGPAPSVEIACKIAQELQEKNLYVFMSCTRDGKTMADQLVEGGMQIGWSTRLVPFGPDNSATVFAFGFATRAAMSFGGMEGGDFRNILIYNKDRVFAFAITFGYVDEEWYANGLGAVNYGFPVIADTDIPEVLPTGVCTYEHVVSNIPHDQIVQKATEVRGLKVTVADVPIPVSYGPAFEGERVRGPEVFFEAGGGRTPCVELVKTAELDAIVDGEVTLVGPDLDSLGKDGGRLPLAVVAEVAGRKFQSDFEPIVERQIHHLTNYAQGIMHIGQRDIAWYRFGRSAFDKGFRLGDIGRILHAKFHQEFGQIIDKVKVTIYTEEAKVNEILAEAKGIYQIRDERVEGMKDEDADTFFSCTLCQSFAPNHVCVVTPERTGLCGAYSWLDCRAAFEISPTGPNQPIDKIRTIDERLGQWEGVNDFVSKASRGNVPKYNAYSIMEDPMTSCGCFECIAGVLPTCNGLMTVDRDYRGMTPTGMKFTTLAGTVGGGQVVPGFVGHAKSYIISRKFVAAEQGILRLVWMPKKLKEEVAEKFNKIGAELGYPNLTDMIADETVGVTEEEIYPWLEEKGHPALKLESLF
jgi:acetyl-CoA synthase